MKKIIIISFLEIWILAPFNQGLKAQNSQFSQYYAAPLHLNSAFTGATYYARANMNFRTQWPSGNSRLNSYLASYDRYFHEYKTGVGGFVNHFDARDGLFSLTQINASGAYALDLGQGHSLRFGLQPGLSFKSSMIGNYLFGDQISGNLPNSIDPTAQQNVERKTYFEVSSGALLTEKNFWVGITAKNFNRPNISLTQVSSRLAVYYSLHGGYKFMFVDRRGLVTQNEKSLTLTGNLRHQGISTQLDLGLYTHLDPLVLGFWYRGFPIKSNSVGLINNDAIVALVGIKIEGLQMGYSFDYTISKLAGRWGNAHELSLIFEFGERMVKKKSFKKLPTMYMPYPKI
ncbi:MAG: PorP/SprF family type IX secretion system membrane protein [Cytophagales bacterium]